MSNLKKENKIKIFGASENNLKNISLELPKDKLIVFSGVSGSGKSTLAFDTLYQEGQRRYIESLSSYARQFLGSFEKPKVDRIEGLSPSISIDQKTRSNNPRSTVGTVTEIYDFLRLLYAGISKPYDLKTNKEIKKYSPQDVTDIILNEYNNKKVQIAIEVVKNGTINFKKINDRFLRLGFVNAFLNDKAILLEQYEDKKEKGNLLIVIDRLIIRDDNKSRIHEGIEHAYQMGEGFVVIKVEGEDDLVFNEEYSFSEDLKIIKEPRLFSFNTPLGACPSCNGLGFKKEISKDLLLDYDKPLLKGGVIAYKNAEDEGLIYNEIRAMADYLKLDISKKIKDLDKEKLNILLYGYNKRVNLKMLSSNKREFVKEYYEGIITTLERRYHDTTSDWIRTWIDNYMIEKTCTRCNGTRLNDNVLLFKVGGLNIVELTDMQVDKIYEFLENLKLSKTEEEISKTVLLEIKSRLKFLIDVGLNYLTLSRMATTLSGGEAQRIRLATQIGSNLSGVLYVLDEPSIGLHQKDNERLLNTLFNMKEQGNTLLVVEHDDETILAADHVVDIGKYAGELGGEIVFEGKPEDLINCKDSLTGDYLSGRRKILVPERRLLDFKKSIVIKGAKENNLKNIDVKIPLHSLVVVTGVSGSGKSSLINDVLLKALRNKFSKEKLEEGKYDSISFGDIKKVIEISQDPIGRTPRSNPATYTGVFDDIRELYSKTTLARARGYDKSRFSFNLKGGRCASCKGDGETRIAMYFLPDVYVKCETCKGKRYNNETLDIKYKEKTISDVLDMTISDAYNFFKDIPKIEEKLHVLVKVGLGYLRLGQIAPTLSGGEAQRVKLAKELSKRITKDTLYILDEPTTGLHPYDVDNLIKILQEIVSHGASMIIIEHNLDIIKQADYVIDLGPDGGNLGGEIVAMGTPEEVAASNKGYTSKYLKEVLKNS